MSKFRIFWPSSKITDVEVDEAIDVDAYAMSRWGQPSAEHVFDEFGVRVEQVAEDTPLEGGNVIAAKGHDVSQAKSQAEQKAALIAAEKAIVAGQDSPK